MSEWTRQTLAEVADIRISNVDKKETEGQKSVRLCNYMDVYSNSYIARSMEFMEATASQEEITKFKVSKGDVLITKDSETPFDIGIPSVVVDEIQDLVCGYHLALIKPDQQKVDSIFLSKILASKASASYFSRLAAGSTRYGLSNGAIAKTPLSIPGLVYQKKVAEILETLDRVIEKTGSLVKKYRQIKIGLMHDLFTRGIDTHGGLRPVREQAPDLYEESPIGWVPKGWKYVRLESLFAFEAGITLGVHRRPRNAPKPYLRVANVFKEEVRLNDVAYMEATQAEALRYGLRLNDLLLVEGHANIDEIGRCAIVGEDAEGLLFQNHLFRLIANGVEPRFGMYYLNSHFSRRYWKGKCSTSSGLNTINRKMLGAMGFLVPDRTEQERIVAALDAARLRLEQEKLMLEKYSKKRSGLMNDLLTGKVSINIEPAPTDFKHV